MQHLGQMTLKKKRETGAEAQAQVSPVDGRSAEGTHHLASLKTWSVYAVRAIGRASGPAWSGYTRARSAKAVSFHAFVLSGCTFSVLLLRLLFIALFSLSFRTSTLWCFSTFFSCPLLIEFKTHRVSMPGLARTATTRSHNDYPVLL